MSGYIVVARAPSGWGTDLGDGRQLRAVPDVGAAIAAASESGFKIVGEGPASALRLDEDGEPTIEPDTDTDADRAAKIEVREAFDLPLAETRAWARTAQSRRIWFAMQRWCRAALRGEEPAPALLGELRDRALALGRGER